MRNIWTISRFSFAYNAKRKSTWIYFGIISVMFLAMMIAVMKFNTSSGGSRNSLDVASSTKPFVGIYLTVTSLVAALLMSGFLSKIAATTFVDGESDGTTLLVVSRKYTRMDVILGRFLALLFWVLIYSTMMFISVLLPSLIMDGSKHASEKMLFILFLCYLVHFSLHYLLFQLHY